MRVRQEVLLSIWQYADLQLMIRPVVDDRSVQLDDQEGKKHSNKYNVITALRGSDWYVHPY